MIKILKVLITIVIIIVVGCILLYFFPPGLKYKFLYYAGKQPDVESENTYDSAAYRSMARQSTGFVLDSVEGIYFTYDNKLMLMNNDVIKEVYSTNSFIYGLSRIGERVYFSDQDFVYVGNGSGFKEIIKYDAIKNSDSVKTRIANNAIYSFSNREIIKYNGDGKEMFNKTINNSESYYSRLLRYIAVINNYAITCSTYGIDILKPYYYMFNKDEVEYLRVSIVPKKNFDLEENAQEYIDIEKCFVDRMDESQRREIADKGLRLTSLVSSVYSPVRLGQFYNGRLYFIPRLSGYFEHPKKPTGVFFTEKVEDIFICSMIPNWDAKHICTDVDFDILYNGNGEVDYIMEMQIKGDKMYFTACKNNQVYLYRLNMESSQVEKLYKFKVAEISDIPLYAVNMYSSKDFLFFYIIFNKNGTGELRNSPTIFNTGDIKTAILRLDNDGKNPVLVMNTEGEVVMKPLEADK